MNLMAILTAIVTFFRYLPELVKIWTQVAQLLQDYADKKAAKEKAKEIAAAIGKARETKDTTDLEQIFGPKSFNITFKTIEEKKSLDVGALSFDAKLIVEKPAEIDPLVLATDMGTQYVSEVQPQFKEIKSSDKDQLIAKTSTFSFMGFGGGQSSVGITSTFVNHNKMTGGGRMGSKFFVFFAILTIIGGCKTGAKNEPNYKPKLYAGDSQQGGMYRKQSNELIRSNDPKFDQMVGMSYATFACIHKTYIQNCREYKEAVVSCEGLDANFYRDYIESMK